MEQMTAHLLAEMKASQEVCQSRTDVSQEGCLQREAGQCQTHYQKPVEDIAS
jgi:hypothetical protein